MKGGTGILIDANNESAFNDFMNNSTFEYFSRGSNGMIFVATLNPGVVSTYQHLDASTYGTPVTKLIIKMCFIIDNPDNYNLNLVLNPIMYDDFKNEVNIQTDIFLKTMNYLQPICPSIVYAGLLEPSHPIIFKIMNDAALSLVYKLTSMTKLQAQIYAQNKGHLYVRKKAEINESLDLLKSIDIHFQKGEIHKFGIIAMEFADNYKTIHDELFTNPIYTLEIHKRRLENIARYIVIELAIKTGYNHGDYHKSNILINSTKNTYFKGLPAEPLIIDFGYAVKLSEKTIKEIKELYKRKEYISILKTIYCIPRADGLMINDPKHIVMYGYTCEQQTAQMIAENNNQIDQLIQLKKEATDDIIERFDVERTQKHLPHLPLSNKIKNKMYIGMIDDITPLHTVQIGEINMNYHFFKNPQYMTIYMDSLFYECSRQHKLRYYIKCCYYYIYLIQLYNPEKAHFPLFMVIILYYFGINTNMNDLII